MSKRMYVKSRGVVLALASLGIIVVAAVGLLTFPTESEVTPINMNADKVAIRGFDTVAYFTDGKAMKGQSEFEHLWQGARWQFASATNRDLFAANPERYAPKYGGYCSMGLAIGEFSDADPEVWTIVEGQLYLNKVEWVQEVWRKGADAYIVASELNWNKHRDELRVNENLR